MSSQVPDTTGNLIVKQLVDLLGAGNAHVSLDEALDNLTLDLAGTKLENLPYSIWQIAEHIRIAQWDILEFSRDKDHKSPKWPEEYWPKEARPASKEALDNCISEIKKDRDQFIKLLQTPGIDIYKPFSYGDGQSLLKEALVLADHNSYHTGEIIIIRRLLNSWR